jgi:hypothetical protein
MKKIIFVFTALLFGVSFVFAQSWQMVGPRAMGMGGAGVATAYGPDAQYWNPAGLAQDEDVNETGFLINAGISLETTKNILEGVSNLTDMSDKYKNLQHDIDNGNAVSAENISTIFKGLNDVSKMIGKDMGALINVDGGVGFKIKNFSVSARALSTGAILPVVDTKNIKFYDGGTGLTLGAITTPGDATNISTAQKLADAITAAGIYDSLKILLNDTSSSNSLELANAIINAASGSATPEQIASAVDTAIANMGGAAEIINMAASADGSYKNNETLAMADAAAFGEVSLGYGMKVHQGVKVGANFKVISGYTAQNGVMIMEDDQKIEDILDKTKDNKKNTTNIAIDLGALVNFSELLQKDIVLNPQFGLTARNINGPKFDRPDIPAGTPAAIAANWNTDKYQLKPQLRAGAAINPAKWMTLAVDLDITENDTMIKAIQSRQLALGAEFNLVNKPKFNLPLRIGYNKNLAESNMAPVYTAGIGFNMVHFYLELAGAMSTKSAKIDGNDIPTSAAASLTLGLLF